MLSIRITIQNCKNGLFIGIATTNKTDNIIIKDNYIAKDTPPFIFSGRGSSRKWTIRDNYFNHPYFDRIPGNIKVKELVIENNKKKRINK